MRLESRIEDIHGAGAEVIAISVNEDERQAGMAERWKLKNIQLVSDPGGERYLDPLGLYDADERGGIALPGNIVIGPDGAEAFRFNGRDFADRTTDDEQMAALVALGLDPVDPAPWTAGTTAPEDLLGFFRPADYGTYFRGNRFGAIAIAGRLESKEAVAVARAHRFMAETSLDAWDTLNKG